VFGFLRFRSGAADALPAALGKKEKEERERSEIVV
jgi:hypothetical protein